MISHESRAVQSGQLSMRGGEGWKGGDLQTANILARDYIGIALGII